MNNLKSALIVGVFPLLIACGGGGSSNSTNNTNTNTSTPPPTSGSSNSAPQFTGPTSFTFSENRPVAFTLGITDADGDTVTITDDENGDGGFFSLDPSTGRVSALTENSSFNFENPMDFNGDNVYEQNITLSDGEAETTQTITVTITNVVETPVYTGSTSFTLEETSSTIGLPLSATDPDRSPLVYTLSGPDADQFNVENGRLGFNTDFDFENPIDENGDNVYEFDLTIANSETSITEPITLTVIDVNEDPVCSTGEIVKVSENFTGDIFTFAGSDPEGDPASFGITLESPSAPDFAASLSFDSATGVVSVTSPFDFETLSVASTSVQTTFGPTPCDFTLEITDVVGTVSSGVRIDGEFVKTNAVGDIDGDGLSEIWLSESAGNPSGYLVFSRAVSALMPNGLLDISSSTPSQAVKLQADAIAGAADDNQILVARRVGDIDGDGNAELLLGIDRPDGGIFRRPAAYIVWGEALNSNTSGLVSLDEMEASEGFALPETRLAEEDIGLTSGDFDGDAVADIAIGLPNSGELYVAFGTFLNSAKSQGTLNLATADRTEVLNLNFSGQDRGDQFGNELVTIPDIDGDGTDELIVRFDLGFGTELGSEIRREKEGGASDTFFNEEIQFSGRLDGVNRDPFDIEGDGIDDLFFGTSDSNGLAIVEPGATIAGPRTQSGKAVTSDLFAVRAVSLAGIGDLDSDNRDEFALGLSAGSGSNTSLFIRLLTAEAFLDSPDIFTFPSDDFAAGEGLEIRGLNELSPIAPDVSGIDDLDGDGLREMVLTSPTANQVYILRGLDLSNGLLSGGTEIDLNPLFNVE